MYKIINFCPTGTQSSKLNSNAPIYVNEIIEEVLACAETGITMVHLHARDVEGNNTYKKAYFQRIIEGIKRNNSELLIGISLSGRYYNDRKLRAEALSLQPDFGSLTMSSMNFPQAASVNDPETIVWLIEEMEKYGVQPEIECFDAGMLNYTNYLCKKQILTNPLYVNVILGNLFNAGTDLTSIANLKNHFPLGAKICIGGIGAEQLKANIYGLLEADGVRVGLEDNFYYMEKTKATNLELIQRIHRISKELGMEIMSSSTLRNLGYGNKKS
jgi:3-keto-5-aminohexanoate cleavage enzyme